MKASELSFKISVDNVRWPMQAKCTQLTRKQKPTFVKGFKIVLPREKIASRNVSLRYYQQQFNLQEVNLTGVNVPPDRLGTTY